MSVKWGWTVFVLNSSLLGLLVVVVVVVVVVELPPKHLVKNVSND